jgi:cation transport ATPase
LNGEDQVEAKRKHQELETLRQEERTEREERRGLEARATTTLAATVTVFALAGAGIAQIPFGQLPDWAAIATLIYLAVMVKIVWLVVRPLLSALKSKKPTVKSPKSGADIAALIAYHRALRDEISSSNASVVKELEKASEAFAALLAAIVVLLFGLVVGIWQGGVPPPA